VHAYVWMNTFIRPAASEVQASLALHVCVVRDLCIVCSLESSLAFSFVVVNSWELRFNQSAFFSVSNAENR
jgi:hypothetical protein